MALSSLHDIFAFEDKKNPGNVIEDFVRLPIWADVQDGIVVKLYQQYTP